MFKFTSICAKKSSELPVGDSRRPICLRDWYWAIGFFVAVVLSRIFPILCNQELNVDESLMLEQAMRYQRDWVPWRSVDGLTSGPINTWALLGAHFLGLPLTFSGAHAFGALLLGGVVSGGFLLARRSFGGSAAAVGAGTAVVWLACNQGSDFTHYSSELVPLALLTSALLVLTASPLNRRAQLILTALGGLALGLIPWAKLQAAPIAGEVFFWFGVSNFWIERSNRPWGRAIALVLGAIAPALAILSSVVKAGVWPVFLRSYIISNLDYAGQKSIRRMVADSLRILVAEPIGPWLLIVCVLGLIVYLRGLRVGKTTPSSSFRRDTWFAWLLLGSVGFICVRPVTQFLHYTLLLLLPLILVTAGLVRASARMASSVEKQKAISRAWVIACAAGWIFYIGGLAKQTRAELLGIRLLRARRTDASAVIAKVREVAPGVRTIEVWGWYPSIYVQLGQPASTRYGIPHRLYTPGRSRDFLRQIYLDDLIQANPDVVVKMCGAIERQWTKEAGFFPDLAGYIESNYDLRWRGQTPFYQEAAELEIYVRRGHP